MLLATNTAVRADDWRADRALDRTIPFIPPVLFLDVRCRTLDVAS